MLFKTHTTPMTPKITGFRGPRLICIDYIQETCWPQQNEISDF